MCHSLNWLLDNPEENFNMNTPETLEKKEEKTILYHFKTLAIYKKKILIFITVSQKNEPNEMKKDFPIILISSYKKNVFNY